MSLPGFRSSGLSTFPLFDLGSRKAYHISIIYCRLTPLSINSTLKYCFSDLFADDATFHTSNLDINIINSELQSDLGGAKTWGIQNKMYMPVGARHRLINLTY